MVNPKETCQDIVLFVHNPKHRPGQPLKQMIDSLSSYWCVTCLYILAQRRDIKDNLATKKKDIDRDKRYLLTIRNLISKIDKNSDGLSCGEEWVDNVRKMKW